MPIPTKEHLRYRVLDFQDGQNPMIVFALQIVLQDQVRALSHAQRADTMLYDSPLLRGKRPAPVGRTGMHACLQVPDSAAHACRGC